MTGVNDVIYLKDRITIKRLKHPSFTSKNRSNFTIMEKEIKKGVPDNSDLEKSKAHIIVEIIEYMTNSVVIKTIIKKSTGNISVMSFDSGEGLTEKTSPFDTFAQVIDGSAEITVNRHVHHLQLGEGMIIPAHAPNRIKANQRFKMLLTTIKSGYEE